ncbi:alkene reductase [Kitasatospora aureofaciens]|uniref:Alkene reductase n=1 Tax=Kitasatospora aureofaciens TaxID=1894 RepID=A0A1E7N1U8_KITAU|nr:alkene reductase [Kitasatospora aureofaciens]QEV03487.1 alkene reductase [Streptomyces viridifaciens]ARF81983.1 alkene reductase [Kitasatospora aureofaciens]OEV34651.1 alkene reductase [Kitasatospora aureofaciens]UKZ03710.1 alkene reductase [Streptomyces viridifaciens]GGV01839.1 alkene reductase [Kitasatospora aureofaciens]
MTTAFDPIVVGGRRLASRIAMAPMTRSRAYGPGAEPTELMATYYAQRASAGLIVTEGIQPSPVGQGYPDTPGLHTAGQVAAWRTVTDAVHAEGGVIFAQLMHTGRIGHPSLLPEGLVPVGPSAVTAKGQVFTHKGPKEYVTPQQLSEAEIEQTIADFAAAARNAIEAGFDGVEIHGANGYLVHQFLAPNTNLRTDAWGGNVEGRIRFAAEVTAAVTEAIGSDRVGLRISPGNPYNDIAEPQPGEVYEALLERIADLDLAYLHLMEGPDRDLTARLRKAWPGTFVLNPFTYPEVTGPDALALVEDGTADMVAYGALFLANPDLPARLAAGGPFNTPDAATFYGGDHRGYTDYPTLTA